MHPDVGEVDLASHAHVPANTGHLRHSRMISFFAPEMLRLSHLKGLPLLGEMIAPEVLEIRWVRSLRSVRRGVGYLLAWLDRSFWVNRRFDDRQLGFAQKPATQSPSARQQ